MKFCIAVHTRDVIVITGANYGNHPFTRFRIAGVAFQVFPPTFDIVFTRALPCQRVMTTTTTTTNTFDKRHSFSFVMTEAVNNIEQVKVPRLLKVGYCLLFS